MRTYCITQGTLLNTLWWPEQEGSPNDRGHMYMHGWFVLQKLIEHCKTTMKVKVSQSCPTLCHPMDYTVHGILQALILEQVAFPFSKSKGSNPGLPNCRRLLYWLSHKGSPRILEWVAYPFSSGSSWARNRTRVSCIVGRFFTNWAKQLYSNKK